MMPRSKPNAGQREAFLRLKLFAQALLQSHSAGEAKRLIDPMLAQLCQLTGLELHPGFFLDTEASITAFGKAVSPTTAAQCAEDPERSRVFIQGICQAIQDKLKANSNHPVHILYAGTGPFAWLILALLPLFTVKQVRLTLLDIHRASLESVEKLLAYFDVADRVDAIICADATLWRPASTQTFDLIISETMKHLLQQEPQVQIFSHLQHFLAEDGCLIPESIELDAWLELKERLPIYLGPLFCLDLAQARLLAQGDRSGLVGSLLLPDYEPQPISLKLTTKIRVYGEHQLLENQSQLTLSQYKKSLWLKPLSRVDFRYELGVYPDFIFQYQQHKLALVGSEDLSCLGIYHLQRLWQKIQLQKRGQTNEVAEGEWILDKALLDLCGIGLEPGMKALYQFDKQTDFIAFAQRQTKLTTADIVGINQRLRALSQAELESGNTELAYGNALPQVLTDAQLAFWQREGYLVIPQVLSKAQCAVSRAVIWQQLGANENEPSTWYQSHELMQKIMLQLFRHPILDANRQAPLIRQAFEQLWQRTDLVMTTDRVSFNPPETPTWQFPGPNMHWDMPLQLPVPFGTQGLIYLTDTPAEQGAFCCVPGFHLKIETWLQEQNKTDTELQQQRWEEWPIKPIAASAGDLIIWHHALPHGPTPNRGVLPRMVQYINFYPMAS
ncbi:phytanoyl-CoA dioxygenase [Shewanella xiamenensis]|uniref:Phytanoyl-CoA dioxygenase n=1 Tax=Shewanella xiamenensis TaxID=332186 RepID=A0AAW6QYP8_9GAMM|nr:phytanoyl-CoA dioxygenase family protein [Shewanella xiamenensis]MDG5901149.1 phytanoyl-CoA dioxygenase [Shewanella xiamenensis]